MEINILNQNRIAVTGVQDFSLAHVFDCGQCFRWKEEDDGSWTGVAYGRILNVRAEAEGESGKAVEAGSCGGSDVTSRCTLVLEPCTVEEFELVWKEYFDLDRDYGAMKKDLSLRDPRLAEVIPYGDGIRLLRQDPWETLISFIISQNNNIPRIRGCIERLCEAYGERLGEYRGRVCYSFPEPESLAAAAELNACRLGYREKYILRTARTVAMDQGAYLRSLRGASEAEVQEYLKSLCGVGPKVASCIMLFSLDQHSSFPIDVWMKKVMAELYRFSETDTEGMQCYAREHFHPYEGFAQQYLFYYMREYFEPKACIKIENMIEP